MTERKLTSIEVKNLKDAVKTASYTKVSNKGDYEVSSSDEDYNASYELAWIENLTWRF